MWPISVLEVAVTVEKMECSRLSDRTSENTKSEYTVKVSLEEKQRRPDGVTLSFSLELTGTPQVALIIVSGFARLTGSDAEIRESLEVRSEKAPPPVAEAIYEKLYGLLYLVAGSMRIPYPLPNLLKKTG
jgi:hypothetical protein